MIKKRPRYKNECQFLNVMFCLATPVLENHHRHLKRGTIPLTVNRDTIVDNLLAIYADPEVAVSRVTVKMSGEQGLDGGGVTADMFTTFWNKARELYFEVRKFIVVCNTVKAISRPYRAAAAGPTTVWSTDAVIPLNVSCNNVCTNLNLLLSVVNTFFISHKLLCLYSSF